MTFLLFFWLYSLIEINVEVALRKCATPSGGGSLARGTAYHGTCDLFGDVAGAFGRN
jgi:hypothetical protein